MSQERASYDAEGTIEIETVVLLDLLEDACEYLREYSNHIEHGRCVDLRRRVLGGQVYVGVNDWPVEGE